MPTAIERELFSSSLDELAKPVVDKLRELFPFVDYNRLKFEYLRDGATSKLGDCNYKTSVIRVHPGLEGDNLKQALVHEVAHFVAYHWKQEKGHSHHWAFFMIMMGYEPRRLVPEGMLSKALLANK